MPARSVVGRKGDDLTPTLSICIPTYNFGEFIGATLASIVAHVPADLEIVVVDGASTDNTAEIVGSWQQRFPGLKYFRLEKRGGIDHDLAKSIELATGDYCWLFSSDDIMRADALERVQHRIRSAHDLYVCRHTICDKSMRRLWDHPVFADGRERLVEFSDAAQRRECLEAAENTEALFSFMGSLVIRKEKWDSVQPVPEFMSSCWGHVARLLAIGQRQLKVCYVPETWLDKRGDNDSFLERGVVNRFRIAIDGFVGISRHFFGEDSPETRSVKRFLRNELPLSAFLYARDQVSRSPDTESRAELDRIFELCYRGRGFSGVIVGLLYSYLPIGVYRHLKTSYAFVRNAVRRFKGGSHGAPNP